MKETHAIAALIKKTDQNISFAFFDCFGSASGILLLRDLKNLRSKNSFAIGMSITRAKIILKSVRSSFQCHI